MGRSARALRNMSMISEHSIEIDVSASGVDESSVSYDDPNNATAQQEKVEALSRRETRVVLFLRLLVLSVLIFSTIVLAYVVHDYLKTTEEEKFQDEFDSAANKVLTSIGSNLDLTLGAIDALAVSFLSYARATNQSWPFVTLPDFGMRATKARRLGKSIYLTMHHVVEAEERAAWEAYTSMNNAWVNESVVLQANDPDYHGVNYFDHYYLDEIVDNCEYAVPEADRYIPSWQTSPAIPKWSPYNWDALSWSDPKAYEHVTKNKKVLVSESWLLPDTEADDDYILVEHNSTIEWISDYVLSSDQDPDEPIVDIYYPILDSLNVIRVANPEDEKLVGFIALAVYWRQMLENTLPSRTQGVVVVVENPCNPTFTFQIDGPTVHYLGRDDQHNPKFDNMEVSARLFDLSNLENGKTYYSGLPLDESYCSHMIRIYPSETFEDDYITNDPIIFPIVVAGIFLFTSLVFVTYDQVVELRQRRLLSKAKVSSAIVSSLFPKQVRDQLYKEAKEKEDEKKNTFVSKNQSSNPDMNYSADQVSTSIVGRPIANLFTGTTIFFADLVGFTKWSAKRSPEQVFKLLENIYACFDEIAAQRGVFKVETIGDCYVAATGLPEPQKDHALIMVRFARDCMFKLSFVTNKLAGELGDDTNTLQLRIGLHSGETTAGVLRGIKGRFQLFGDTVNTASRMESTGTPGHIQISQTTADLLRKRGKGSWFEPRPDKVEAKGKGLMQTYFIKIGSTKSSSSPTTIDFSETENCLNGTSQNIQWDEEDDKKDASAEDLSEGSEELGDKIQEYMGKNSRRGSPTTSLTRTNALSGTNSGTNQRTSAVEHFI